MRKPASGDIEISQQMSMYFIDYRSFQTIGWEMLLLIIIVVFPRKDIDDASRQIFI